MSKLAKVDTQTSLAKFESLAEEYEDALSAGKQGLAKMLELRMDMLREDILSQQKEARRSSGSDSRKYGGGVFAGAEVGGQFRVVYEVELETGEDGEEYVLIRTEDRDYQWRGEEGLEIFPPAVVTEAKKLWSNR